MRGVVSLKKGKIYPRPKTALFTASCLKLVYFFNAHRHMHVYVVCMYMASANFHGLSSVCVWQTLTVIIIVRREK